MILNGAVGVMYNKKKCSSSSSTALTPVEEEQVKLYKATTALLSNKSMGSAPKPVTESHQQLLLQSSIQAPIKKDQQLHYYNYWAITPFGINASSSFIYKPRIHQSHISTNVDPLTPSRATPHIVQQDATVSTHAMAAARVVTETQLLENQAPPLIVPLGPNKDSFTHRNTGVSDQHTDDVIHAYHVNQKLQQVHRCMLESLRDQTNMPITTTAEKDLKDVSFLTCEPQELQELMYQPLSQQARVETGSVENEIKEMPLVQTTTEKILDVESNEMDQAIGLKRGSGPMTSACCSSSSSSSICETKQGTIMTKFREEGDYEPSSNMSRIDSNSMEKCIEESQCKPSSNMSRMENNIRAKCMEEGGQYEPSLNTSKINGNSMEKSIEEGKYVDEERVLNGQQSSSLLNNIYQAAGLALDMITNSTMYCSACTNTGPCTSHVGLFDVPCMNYMHANFNTGDAIKEPCFLYQHDYTVQPEYEQQNRSLQYCIQAQDNDVVEAPLFISGSPLPFADHDLLVDVDPLDEQALHIWDY